jgi:hypothetical protein
MRILAIGLGKRTSKNADTFYLVCSIEKVAYKVNVKITSREFPGFGVSGWCMT